MMDPLFSLPAEIWRDQILIYLSLLDIAKASNSFLNREVQRKFLSLTNGCTLRAEVVVRPNQEKMLNWCLARNLLTTNVFVCEDLDPRSASILPDFVARVTRLSHAQCSIDPTWCPRLVNLRWGFSPVRNMGSLCAYPNLTTLSLYFCKQLSTQSLLDSLTGCDRLESCSIRGCEQVNERAITRILIDNPRLRTFEFGGDSSHPYDFATIFEMIDRHFVCNVRCVEATLSTTICSAGMHRLPTVFPQLQKLHLDDSTSNVSDGDVNYLCENCPMLTDLRLSRFEHLSSATLLSVARYLPLLRKLNVSRCICICDEGLIAVAKTCVLLQALNISYCGNITTIAMREVWLSCTLLEDLSITHCLQITDAAFAERVSFTLQYLDVSWTRLTGLFNKQTPMLTTLYGYYCADININLVTDLATQLNNVQAIEIDEVKLSVCDLLLLSSHLPNAVSVSISGTNANDEVLRSFAKNCPRLQCLVANSCANATKAVRSELRNILIW